MDEIQEKSRKGWKAFVLGKKKKEYQPAQYNETVCGNDQRRKKLYKKFCEELTAEETKISRDSIVDYYFDKELDDKMVVMIGLGKNVRGNLQYILNELNGNELFEGFRIYVRTSEQTDGIVKKFIEENSWNRTETVPGEKKYRELMETAKYLITEVYFPEGWLKKEGQVYINIWHGTPLKKLGLAKNSKNCQKNGVTQRNFIDADYLLYPNNYTCEKMLESYKVSSLMQGKKLLLGYPRTGGMMAAAHQSFQEIRERLAPNGEKLYAYMPTFKDYLKSEEVVAQARELLDYMEENLEESEILYVNLHHKVSDSLDYGRYRRIKKFPETVDSYKLLAETEALISDYSSVFFDYLALRKQIILYIPDYEQYTTKRGVYVNLLNFPFDKETTKEGVLEALRRGKTYDDREVFEEFCQYDSEKNAQKLCQLILGSTDGLRVEEIQKNDKFKVLIYTEECRPGEATQLLQGFTRFFDREQSEVYLSCDMDAVDKNKVSAYPMFFENPVIGALSNSHLGGLGKALKKQYTEGKLSFEEAIEYMKYEYALMPIRMYGRAKFDLTVIYDTENPEIILALAAMPGPKLLFLQKGMLQKMQEGERFFADAIRYATRFCAGIFVENARDKKTAKTLLEKDWKNEIYIVSSVKELNNVVFNERWNCGK